MNRDSRIRIYVDHCGFWTGSLEDLKRPWWNFWRLTWVTQDRMEQNDDLEFTVMYTYRQWKEIRPHAMLVDSKDFSEILRKQIPVKFGF